MVFNENIQFVNPEFFLLLLLLPLAGFWYLRRRKQHYASLRMPSLDSVKGVRSWRGMLRAALPILRALAFIALVVAMARPQLPGRPAPLDAEGIDIALVLDVSTSMNAIDFQPNDRMHVARETLSEFIQQRDSDRIALVVFAGEAFTQVPLTLDYDLLHRVHSAEQMLQRQQVLVGQLR